MRRLWLVFSLFCFVACYEVDLRPETCDDGWRIFCAEIVDPCQGVFRDALGGIEVDREACLTLGASLGVCDKLEEKHPEAVESLLDCVAWVREEARESSMLCADVHKAIKRDAGSMLDASCQEAIPALESIGEDLPFGK